MDRFRWSILVAAICLPVALLAAGVRIPFLDTPVGGLPRPLPVPTGDQELAWLHTSVHGTTWERFVSGVARAQMVVPGLKVDDSRAFREQTYEVPELVLTMAGRPGRLRIRWYKLTSEAGAGEWVEALAARRPAPLAVVGGGTTDRAVELAQALAPQHGWHGDRPLLFLTTATAETLDDARDGGTGAEPPSLVGLYPGRTFRFCFSNRQMADAVIDFVWTRPDLRPQLFRDVAPLAVCSGLAAAPPEVDPKAARPVGRPQVFTVWWRDDPFSTDLQHQFGKALMDKLTPDGPPSVTPVRLVRDVVPFSVGGMYRPNPPEAKVVEAILDQYRDLPPQRSLLVLPTVTNPARRLLRTLSLSAPQLAHRMVAVTGDGVPVNAVFRDGEFAWPVHTMPVPLVMFTHNNPVAWDEPAPRTADPPPGYELHPPTTTEEVLHFTEMGRIIAEAAFGLGCGDPAAPPPPGGLATRAEALAEKLRDRCPAFFDRDGNRAGGSGEYVVVLRPRSPDDTPVPDPEARIDVWRHDDDRRWSFVRGLEIDQWRTRGKLEPAGNGGKPR